MKKILLSLAMGLMLTGILTSIHADELKCPICGHVCNDECEYDEDGLCLHTCEDDPAPIDFDWPFH